MPIAKVMATGTFGFGQPMLLLLKIFTSKPADLKFPPWPGKNPPLMAYICIGVEQLQPLSVEYLIKAQKVTHFCAK
jgi:hypothetical protein